MSAEDNSNFNFEEEMKKAFSNKPNPSPDSPKKSKINIENIKDFLQNGDFQNVPKDIKDILNKEDFQNVVMSLRKQMAEMFDTFVVTEEAMARVLGYKNGMLDDNLPQKLNSVLEDIICGRIKLIDAYG